jgi:hypothetical protein
MRHPVDSKNVSEKFLHCLSSVLKNYPYHQKNESINSFRDGQQDGKEYVNLILSQRKSIMKRKSKLPPTYLGISLVMSII